MTSVVAEFDRAIGLGLLGRRVQAAVFAVLSTPPVRIFGRACNPVARMTPTELAETAQQRYADFDDVTPVESFEGTIGGRPTPVTRFDADARPIAVGREVDVHLYMSGSIEFGNEYVVALAVHPRALGRRAATVERQMAGVVATCGQGEGSRAIAWNSRPTSDAPAPPCRPRLSRPGEGEN